MFRPFQILCEFIVLFLIVLVPRFACPQAEAQAPAQAVVTFTVDFPTSAPEHYSIRVQSDGSGLYQSSGRLSMDSDETDSFDLEFTVGAETRQKIFDLTAKAGYFKKDIDSHHKGLAFTGKKTLAYKDAQRSAESTYNYSLNPAVEALTSLMQDLSATLEFGHRLRYDLQYQKLALDDELKRMETQARSGDLMELGAVKPILQEIYDDSSVMNVVRAKALRIIDMGNAAPAAH
jgi:hypothetical protein